MRQARKGYMDTKTVPAGVAGTVFMRLEVEWAVYALRARMQSAMR